MQYACNVYDFRLRNAWYVKQIFVDDGLPQSICENCTDKLMVCRSFWNQCYSATKVLQTILTEHLSNDSEMKQEVCTEVVYLVKQ